MIAIPNADETGIHRIAGPLSRLAIPIGAIAFSLVGNTYAASAFVALQITTQLNGIGALLGQIAPLLSAAMFILAGIFYAIGQIMPPDKKAAFHTTSVNIIIGAIVLAALSFAAVGLASTSAHLLTNSTANGITTTIGSNTP